MNRLVTVMFLFILSSCSRDKADTNLIQDSYRCQTVAVANRLSRIQLIRSFDAEIVQGIASIDIPTTE